MQREQICQWSDKDIDKLPFTDKWFIEWKCTSNRVNLKRLSVMIHPFEPFNPSFPSVFQMLWLKNTFHNVNLLLSRTKVEHALSIWIWDYRSNRIFLFIWCTRMYHKRKFKELLQPYCRRTEEVKRRDYKVAVVKQDSFLESCYIY